MTQPEMITIERPQPPSIVAELAPLVSAAHEFDVVDVETNGKALERIKALRSGEKIIHEHFEPSRKSADRTKKEIISLRDALINPLAEARTIYDRKADVYEEGERQKAAAEQRRLQAEAQKREDEIQLMDAIEAEGRGDTQERDAIMAEAPSTPVVTVAPQVATVKGVSKRTTWSAEVHDLHKLIKYVAEHAEWVNLLLPNQTALNKLSVAQRDALRIPGVRAVSQSVRGTRVS